MKNGIWKIFIPLLVASLLSACFSSRQNGKKGQTSQRLQIQKQGIILDAKYDSRLDNLIPGYKIITVAVTNNGVDVLRLNPLRDRWEIQDAYGKNRKAVTSLRIRDPATFSRLPGKLQQLIEYPVGISVGYSETVDLFFPASLELDAFRTISFYSDDRKMTYDVLSNLGMSNQIPVTAKSTAQATPDPRFQ